MVSLYRFGRVEIRPAERRILIDGVPAAIGARAFDLLDVLLQHRDRVVGKQELLDRVWPGLVVEENNLQVQISALRRVLGAQAIVTVAGRGYRFVLPMDTEPAPLGTAAQTATPGADPQVPDPPRHNLAPERSRFVGRAQELAECCQLLAEARLLTLVAIGGCGKTRMAMQLARQLLPEQADGVWFVDLAPLQDATRVPLVLGAALGIFEKPGMPLVDSLVQHLSTRRCLIVMDNCEHVAATAGQLIEKLLRACPGLRVLATSRLPLALIAERVFLLPPLACPPRTEAGATESFDAVRLFVDRLQWIDPSFRLSEANAPVVADICRHLDGIPLALELAAARANVLSLPQIQQRLDDRFRLLTGAARGQPRQQTLRATIQWSYDQLTPELQRLLRSVGMFTGSWTLDALVAVASDNDDEFVVLDRLASLVDQSLVVVHPQPGAESRYGLLETVRVFASEQLALHGEAPAARTRHLRYMARWVESGFSKLQGPRQREWLLQLDADRENLLLAHAWADEMPAGDDCALRLVACLQGYWRSRGTADLGYQVGMRALASATHAEPSAIKAQAVSAVGELAYLLGQYAAAITLLQSSLDLARSLGEHKQMALSQLWLGIACLGQGEGGAARLHCAAALGLARQTGDRSVLNQAILASGVVHLAAGELEAARPLFVESLALAHARGTPIHVGLSLLNVAWVSIGLGDANAGACYLLDAIRIAQDIHHESLEQMTLDAFAGWSALTGQSERAARFYGTGQARIDQMRQRRQPAIDALLLPRIAQVRSALGTKACDAAMAEGYALDTRHAVAEARGALERYSAVDAAC